MTRPSGCSAMNADYSSFFSRIFTAVFSVKLANSSKKRYSNTKIDRLARIYGRQAATLFLNADFTKIIPLFRQNRYASARTFIKDALRFPPNNIETTTRMLEQGRDAYLQSVRTQKGKDELFSELDAEYLTFINATVDATEATLIRIVDDNAVFVHLLSKEGLLEIIRAGKW